MRERETVTATRTGEAGMETMDASPGWCAGATTASPSLVSTTMRRMTAARSRRILFRPSDQSIQFIKRFKSRN